MDANINKHLYILLTSDLTLSMHVKFGTLT